MNEVTPDKGTEYCQRDGCGEWWEITMGFLFAGVPLSIHLCRVHTREVDDAQRKLRPTTAIH